MTTNSALAKPLQNPMFRRLWISVLISNLGTMVQTVGAGWLMATITRSDEMVALTQASTSLPVMVLSLLSGALADSFDRRRLMLTGQAVALTAATSLALVTYLGLATPWLLLSLTFLVGCGAALHIPAWQASLGDIVPREHISAAVTLNSMAFNVTRSVGPAVGGLLVAGAGSAAAFACNAASYLPIIISLVLWKRPAAPSRLPRERLGQAVLSGLRYVAMSPDLLVILARGFVFAFGAIACLALLPLVARDELRGDSVTFGLLLGSFGAGAIAGALSSARLRAMLNNEALVRTTALGFAASLVALARSRHPGLACLCLLPAGACWVLSLSLLNTTVQLSTPRWVVGRTLSLYQTASFGGMAVGSWFWGVAAAMSGTSLALLGAAGVVACGAVFGRFFPLPVLEPRDLSPLDHFLEPALAIELEPRNGPIRVTVDYEIDGEDVPAFIEAMTRRRRIRLRDGARQWELMRDLQAPRSWTESYLVPTWTDYLRHHMRRTKADAATQATLLALHRGQGRPNVRRMIIRTNLPFVDDAPSRLESEASDGVNS